MSSSLKKSCDEKVSVFGRVNDFLKYHIIWYNEHHENPLEYYDISSKFRRGVLDYLECFVSMEICQKYIQSLKDDTIPIVLIISVFNSSSIQLIDDENLHDSLHSIYIHREEIDFEKSRRHEKVRSY